MFQSLIGIIGYCNYRVKSIESLESKFQSLIGIIGYCNHTREIVQKFGGSVSIPDRDYWLL